MFKSLLKYSQPLIIALGSTAIIMGSRAIGWLSYSELWAYDQLYEKISEESPICNYPITLIEATEEDIQNYGHPFDGIITSTILRKIQEQEPSVIAFNIYRDQKQDPGDKLFREQLGKSNVVGIALYLVDQTMPPPGAVNVASIDAFDDKQGGMTRRSYVTIKKNGEVVPYLGLLLASSHLRANGKDVSWQSLAELVEPNLIRHPGPYPSTSFDFLHPFPEILVDWKSCIFKSYSFGDVLERNAAERIPPGEIIIIGQSSHTVTKAKSNPVGYLFETPIVAHITAHFLDTYEIQGPSIKLPGHLPILLGLLLLSEAQVFLLWFHRNRHVIVFSAISAVMLSGLLGATIWGYQLAFNEFSLWLPVVPAGAIIVLNGVFATIFIYIVKILAKNKRLEIEISERTKELIDQKGYVVAGQYIEGIFHNARSPLLQAQRSITGLRNAMLEPRAEKRNLVNSRSILTDLDSISHDLEKASNLIDLILQIKGGERIETEKISEDADISKIIESICDFARNSYRSESISISCDLSPGIKAAIETGNLAQVASFLVTNSIESVLLEKERNPEFVPEIKVSSEIEDESIILRFYDNGPGVEPQIKNKILVERVSTKDRPGGGFGLLIARNLIEDAQGQILYNESILHGCEFTVRLPAVLQN